MILMFQSRLILLLLLIQWPNLLSVNSKASMNILNHRNLIITVWITILRTIDIISLWKLQVEHPNSIKVLEIKINFKIFLKTGLQSLRITCQTLRNWKLYFQRFFKETKTKVLNHNKKYPCLLYTSDAADEL